MDNSNSAHGSAPLFAVVSVAFSAATELGSCLNFLFAPAECTELVAAIKPSWDWISCNSQPSACMYLLASLSRLPHQLFLNWQALLERKYSNSLRWATTQWLLHFRSYKAYPDWYLCLLNLCQWFFWWKFLYFWNCWFFILRISFNCFEEYGLQCCSTFSRDSHLRQRTELAVW